MLLLEINADNNLIGVIQRPPGSQHAAIDTGSSSNSNCISGEGGGGVVVIPEGMTASNVPLLPICGMRFKKGRGRPRKVDLVKNVSSSGGGGCERLLVPSLLDPSW